MKQLIKKLIENKNLSKEEFIELIDNRTESYAKILSLKAREISQNYFGNSIYVRGLIEITNVCNNNCYYCGIRKDNKNVKRYKLDKNTILSCCDTGYSLGIRTFVLQGGELCNTDDELINIISAIHNKYPDCAITLSVGEKDEKVYHKFFNAGATRYLLRHEAANDELYKKLHPQSMSLDNRKECLSNLKKIGFQTGTGFMVGAPYQTTENIVEDILYILDFKPHMIGIGPFVPHSETPFKNKKAGTAELTCYLLSIFRICLPHALIPATTSLGTINENGREKGILSGANVLMPNLTPENVRKDYLLYNNKICTGEEAAEGYERLKKRISRIGYELVSARGDYKE